MNDIAGNHHLNKIIDALRNDNDKLEAVARVLVKSVQEYVYECGHHPISLREVPYFLSVEITDEEAAILEWVEQRLGVTKNGS